MAGRPQLRARKAAEAAQKAELWEGDNRTQSEIMSEIEDRRRGFIPQSDTHQINPEGQLEWKDRRPPVPPVFVQDVDADGRVFYRDTLQSKARAAAEANPQTFAAEHEPGPAAAEAR